MSEQGNENTAGGGNGGGGNAGGGGGGGGGPPGNGNPPPALPGWTTPTFVTGVIVGLILVVGALAIEALELVPSGTANLVMCCGLGIVLGAFGTVALVRWQGVVIAGCGAVAVVLFVLLANSAVTHLRLVVAGVPKDVIATLVLENTYTSVANREGVATFLVVERRVGVHQAKLMLTGEVETEFCIPVSRIAGLGTGRTAQWDIQWPSQGDPASLMTDDNSEPIKSQCGARSSAFVVPNLWPIGPAVAQEPPDSITALIADLDAESPLVRREARDGLSLWGEQAIKPMMDVWAADPTHYRNTLGVAVAMTEYLREHKDRRAEVAALLDESDIKLLVDATSHPDRTMRVYATEFLFDLGAPEAGPILLEALPDASPAGQFNAGFVLTNVIPYLSDEQRLELMPEVAHAITTLPLGPETTEKFKEVLTTLKSGEWG